MSDAHESRFFFLNELLHCALQSSVQPAFCSREMEIGGGKETKHNRESFSTYFPMCVFPLLYKTVIAKKKIFFCLFSIRAISKNLSLSLIFGK